MNYKNGWAVALQDIPSWGVKAGDVGGFVESLGNLSQEGDAWVFGDACVFGNARVYGNAPENHTPLPWRIARAALTRAKGE